MTTPTLTQRARGGGPGTPSLPRSRVDLWLGGPAAFLATAVILLLIFGWTFLANPGRPAPADDPAYYTWRTEALVANDPVTLLEATGPLDMYSGGYRVTTPVIAAYFRELGGAALLTPTSLLAVGLRVVIPLLLAGFAYRHRRDPLVFHSVAFGSASLLLTPPFGGYLDNVLTLFFLGASLFFIEPARRSWAARLVFAALLVLSGMTHPTTLATFCVVLGAMAAVRLLFRGFDLRSVIRDDGPMLASAFAAAVATFLIWKIGIWGQSAPLTDAALPPPADADFFKTRLAGWLEAMRPILNGPLFLIGAAGLLAAGKRAAEDDLARVSIVWLAPLAGIFGFLVGSTYPYYRFFNTTLSWILLVGLGVFFAARWFLAVSARGGVASLALLGVVALAVVVGTNFKSGLSQSHWNDPSDAWLKPAQQEELDPVRAFLAEQDPDTPVVFVVDDEAPEKVRIYGFAKLAGNVTRYGVPPEMQDRTAYYLGSLESFRAGQPSTREGDDYYTELSQASLDDVRKVLESAEGQAPVVVVPSAFNATGSNASVAESGGIVLPTGQLPSELDAPSEDGSFLRIPIMLVVLLLLGIPGWLLLKAVFPEAGLADALGLVPALATALLAVSGVVVLAVARAPFGMELQWVAFSFALMVSGVMFVRGRRPLAAAAE